MNKADLIFVHGTSPIDWLIEEYDDYRFSHCAIVSNVDTSPIKIIEANWNIHVQECDIHFKDYTVVSLNLTDDQRERMVQMARSLIGRRYNFKLILSFVVKKLFGVNLKFLNDKNEYICSELIEMSLYSVGKMESKDIGTHTPNSLYKYLLKLNNTQTFRG